MKKKRILVAVLNWGLGHATRCIPIIKALVTNGYEPILASDGAALALLKKEFPELLAEELPSYNIDYGDSPNFLKWKLFLESPRIMKVIKAEKEYTRLLVEKYNLNGIISDNRLGVRYKHLKCVFITHQLNVLSGNTTWLSSKLHQKYIRKFDECWVPDLPGSRNLSGVLGHLKKTPEEVKYMGLLSRFSKIDLPQKYKFMIILSGPEPQRSFLEKILLKEFKNISEKTLFVRGVLDESNLISKEHNPNLILKNYLFGKDLEEALNSSETIVCRSGYTSILDLSKLEKKAFLIPTPGQFEQEYLAERLEKLGIAPSCSQDDFKISKLKSLKSFSGFRDFGGVPDFRSLFALFEGK
ncbi:glycosyltransferase [Salegentibacter sediminis]|uniref:glycosyltransferase n=1 Tax=Salegentibacter sediminis TaxID=1930251 RepID=UPI0009C14C33|nr:glycosyltransferase [Salegentibacter sediminis]